MISFMISTERCFSNDTVRQVHTKTRERRILIRMVAVKVDGKRSTVSSATVK